MTPDPRSPLEFTETVERPPAFPETLEGRQQLAEYAFTCLRPDIVKSLSRSIPVTKELTAAQFSHLLHDPKWADQEPLNSIRRPYLTAREGADEHTRRSIDAALILAFVDHIIREPNSDPESPREKPPIRLIRADDGQYYPNPDMDVPRKKTLEALLLHARTHLPEAFGTIEKKVHQPLDPNEGRLFLESLMTAIQDHPPKDVDLSTWRQCFRKDFRFDANSLAMFDRWIGSRSGS